jgi:hypothetical protein
MQTFLQGNPTVNAFIAAVTTVTLLLISFATLEPMVAQGGDIATSTFTVRQQITGEISFTSPPNNVTMDPSIAGLTGGTAYGTSTFAISTNNPTGYIVTIQFASTTAMLQEGGSAYINNYTPVGSVPDYNFAIGGAGTPGEFAYTINTLDADDLDPDFNDNGTNTCGGGATQGNPNTCWWNQADSSAIKQIIDADGPTIPSGATSTLVFQVAVPANPSPALPTGFYTATATLTATED